jgi:hypothetical protein
MRTVLKIIFWLGLGVGSLLLILIVVIRCDHLWRTRNDSRYAAEGQAAVEEYLRTNVASALKQLHVTNDWGAFLRLEGGRIGYPVWNIQGYHFLDLRRTAYFTGGELPIRIIVSEGRVTAPGLQTVGKPYVRDGMIFVSHPQVRP